MTNSHHTLTLAAIENALRAHALRYGPLAEARLSSIGTRVEGDQAATTGGSLLELRGRSNEHWLIAGNIPHEVLDGARRSLEQFAAYQQERLKRSEEVTEPAQGPPNRQRT